MDSEWSLAASISLSPSADAEPLATLLEATLPSDVLVHISRVFLFCLTSFFCLLDSDSQPGGRHSVCGMNVHP